MPYNFPSLRYTITIIAGVLVLAAVTAQGAEETALVATVTGVKGLVRVRTVEGQPWQKAKAGMKLSAGAEFQTGPRSAVQFKIPPDQTITLDRLGTMKVINAVKSAQGKVKTELGMKYGRTRYQVETAGVEHAATLHTPSSQLAVRGTEVGFQEDFLGVAWCTESQAFFTGFDQQEITFGVGTEVSDKHPQAGRKRMYDDDIDAKSKYAREKVETDIIVEELDGRFDILRDGLLEHRELLGTVGVDPATTTVTGDVEFQLTWNNSDGDAINFSNAFYDLDLFVIAPNETDAIIYAGNPNVPGAGGTIEAFINQLGGAFATVSAGPANNTVEFTTDNGDLDAAGPVGNGDGLRTELITITDQFTTGTYTAGVHLADFQPGADPTPGDVTYQIIVTKMIPGIGNVIMQTELVDFVTDQVPTAAHDINVPAGATTPEPLNFIATGRAAPTP